MEVKSVMLQRNAGDRRYAPAALFIENGTGIRILRWEGGVETRHLNRQEVEALLAPLGDVAAGNDRPSTPFFGRDRGWKLEVQFADGTRRRRSVDGQLSRVWCCLAREFL